MKIIQIKDSDDKENLKLFLEVAKNVYESDSIWSPASDEIFLQRFKAFEQKKDITITPLVMVVNNIPCARSVVISKTGLTNSEGKKQGWISFFEICESQRNHAQSMIEFSENLLKERGAEVVLVPRFDNSIAGLQTSRFELPHTFLSTYNPPFYLELFIDAGYETIKTFYTFYYTRNNIPNIRFKFPKIRTREFNPEKFEDELESFHEISVQSFQQSLGYIPRTFEEDFDMVKSMLPFLDKDLVILAENKQKEAIGFLTCVPDVFQFMEGEDATRVRLMTIAVLPKYRKKGIAAAMCLHLMKNLTRKEEYQYLEISSIDESNIPSLRLITIFGAQKGKEYVILEKKL